MQFRDMFSPQKRLESQAARDLYDLVLAGALNPVLYEKGLAVDTFQGRFEQAALHGALMLRALRIRGQQRVSKALYEAIFAGFDHAYRETGVGDSSISRKMRKLGEQFYGLARGLDQALESHDNEALRAFVVRNGLQNNEKDHLVSYLRSADEGLSGIEELIQTKWPSI